MSWDKNQTNSVIREDLKGDIGGFGRATGLGAQTYIGPIFSPDGTARYIVVDNAGVISSVTSPPA